MKAKLPLPEGINYNIWSTVTEDTLCTDFFTLRTFHTRFNHDSTFNIPYNTVPENSYKTLKSAVRHIPDQGIASGNDLELNFACDLEMELVSFLHGTIAFKPL